jgi:DNA-nicking Smr family endonuclease
MTSRIEDVGDAARRDGDDASDLFREAVRDATPLTDRHRVRVVGPSAGQARRGASPAALAAQGIAAKERLQPDGDGARAHGVSRKTVRELTAGALAVEASLDLHRLRASVARARLDSFVRSSRSAGLRVVLVITGKGERPTSRVGERLRDLVPDWLAGSIGATVLAYAPARAEHGGAGALYVVLRSP